MVGKKKDSKKPKLKPCIRCPDLPTAEYCRGTKYKDIARCREVKAVGELWRGFTNAPVGDLCTVLPSNTECQTALDQAIGIDATARATLIRNDFDSDDAFEAAVTEQIENQHAQFDETTPLSKQLLEHAFQQIHRATPQQDQNQSTGSKKNKQSASNDDAESIITKALEDTTIRDQALDASNSKDVGTLIEAQSSNNATKVDDVVSEMRDLPGVLCNRCPTIQEALNNHNHAGELEDCMKSNSIRDIKPSDLWWAYQNDGSQQGIQPKDLLPTPESSRDFLITVKEDNMTFISEAQTTHGGSLDEQVNLVMLRRFQHEYAGQLITKQMLEFAANDCHRLQDYGSSQSTQRAPAEETTQTLRQLGEGEASWGSSSLFDQASRDPLSIKDSNEKTSSWAKRSDIIKGTERKSGGIVTNHFKITVKPGIKLFEYQVIGLNEEGVKLSANRKKVLLKRLLNNSKILKDGAGTFACSKEGRIIAWKPLKADVEKNQAIELFSINDFSRERQSGLVERVVNLDLVFKREIDLDDLVKYATGNNAKYQETGTAAALDILVGHGVKQLPSDVTLIGNNKFFPTDSAAEQYTFSAWEMVALRGFSSNIKAGNGSLLLNVNTAFSVFYREQTVAEYLQYFKSIGREVQFDKDATNHLIGLRVRILYDRKKDGVDDDIDSDDRRTKTITGFSKKSAAMEEFRDENDKPVKVWTYFKSQHKAAADKSDSNQICVNTGGTQKGTKPCWYLPDQLLVLPGQIYPRTLEKLDAKAPPSKAKSMTEQLIGFACRKPSDNRDAIETRGLKALGLERGAAGPQVLLDAGIGIERSMMNVKFRKILQPAIVYGDKSTAKSEKPASWSSRGEKLLSTAKQITKGVHFIHIGRLRDEEVTKCGENFKKVLPKNGLNTEGYGLQWSFTGTKREEIEACVKSSNADLTVFVLRADKTRPPYADFRSILDQTLGRPSIVFNADRLYKCDGGAYMGGNALKINLRLGNQNHTIKTGFESFKHLGRLHTLVLGADMIHPKQGSATCTPSIGALVGSIDENFAKFLGSARQQEAGKEYIEKEHMLNMAKERIQAWKKKQDKYPDKILFYRDGTGDSQYEDVMKFEVEGIKKAWQACTGKSPKTLQMTTIVAIKRHSTRFYPVTAEHMTQTGNCTPGLVVDRDITSPYNVDFYLQSHDVEMKKDQGQGSAKPTHYFVLENGMKMSETSLQNITNNFCYMSAHSTSAVSYAAPAYYADKLCERASLYLRRFYDNDPDVEELSEETQKIQMEDDWGRGGRGANGNPWNPDLDDKMFWM